MTHALEAILFVASKPLSRRLLAKRLETSEAKISELVDQLALKFRPENSGIVLFDDGNEVQLRTASDHSEIVERFIKTEGAGELTRAQLETLTIIAYQGPVSRPEIELIRGVNCAVILRTLAIRGLITEQDGEDDIVPRFILSVKALAHLGVQSVQDLPEYESVHNHDHLTQFFAREPADQP